MSALRPKTKSLMKCPRSPPLSVPGPRHICALRTVELFHNVDAITRITLYAAAIVQGAPIKLYRESSRVMRFGTHRAANRNTLSGATDYRDQLIQLAQGVAARHSAELYVFDEAGKLEVVYVYSEGIEPRRYSWSPQLRVVPAE